MSIGLEVHIENSYIDIQSVDPKKCFALGELAMTLREHSFKVQVHSWGQGVLIRLPLVEDKDE